MNTLRAGIIGLGKMGLSHAAIVGAQPHVDLVAICDTSAIVTNAFKKYGRATIYSNHRKMLRRENLDFVVIATPTKLHYEMVREALERGVHVFCEKPFSLNSAEGQELVQLAQRKGLVNQLGYHNHFIGTFQEMKRLLATGVIGELVHFSGEAYGPVVTKEKGGTWRSRSSEGGGCLFDYASHVLNLLQEVVGRPVKVNGSLLKQIYSKGVEDAVYTLLTLENGVTGTLLVNWSDETYRKMSTSLTVQGKKGKIVCDATELKVYLKEANTAEGLEAGWTVKWITDLAIPVGYYLRGEEYSAQIEYFIANVRRQEPGTINTFEQGLYTDKVIEMILDHAA
ncbi:Inositol 2-dehydrogenase/D-chiro-inositol 3-dehydrogenase [Neolewinella maritima]|uniref:Inositol 2-dehydrogenase/D-chiro-inositol 3-dehydrogenase n=1 Tax=Neolewinella maritima TaxID=1383882 RepID=A0ABM9AZ92_9BACT|nr:Gfo/Idh/MocA family oxidoreductase [Neolewinella maritima]CAH0999529.1 Inositol 2-dehydrogenase/D-chiro-inositol 3-dehydrogenase [Neolewinella maritima]